MQLINCGTIYKWNVRNIVRIDVPQVVFVGDWRTGTRVPAAAARLQRRPGGRRPARSVLQRGSWTQEAREIRLISKLTSLTFSTCFCSHMTTADYRIQMQK